MSRTGRQVPRWLLAVLLVAAAMLAILWGASAWLGRTPGELLLKAEEAAAAGDTPWGPVLAPALAQLRRAWGGDAAQHGPSAFQVPPLPANPLRAAASARAPGGAGGRVIQVGPLREVRSISLAASTARDGDTVEIDPGDYVGDVAIWNQSDLTIRAAGQRVRLVAGGASAQGKAIWVVHSARRGGRITVEGIDFVGARVPDRNGAGIRFEQGHLVLRDCLFHGNQNGVLTGDDPDSVLEVLQSEFGYNGAGDGFTHQLYVGRIAQLRVEGSWFHHGHVGHLIKSRAKRSRIVSNRLTDEPGGRASYELEFPNGGDAVVLGNLVQQSDSSANSVMVSFGSEGLTWPQSRLHLAFNTLVNDLPGGGTFVQVVPGAQAVVVQDNLWVGRGRLHLGDGGAIEQRNTRLAWDDLVRPGREDYRLSLAARERLAAVDVSGQPTELVPGFEYLHPLQLNPLTSPRRWPGALQAGPP